MLRHWLGRNNGGLFGLSRALRLRHCVAQTKINAAEY